jgi:acyl-CoA synthetase (AMP-forming)/AMP-acid ligase II
MNTWLTDRLPTFGDAPALAWREDCLRYRDLAAEVDRWLTRLDAAQVGSGSCVACLGEFSPGVAAFFLAAFQRRLIVAPLPRTVPARLPFFLETARAAALLDFTTTDRPSLLGLHPPAAHPLQERVRALGAAGLILFSSGTTGDPKAALLNLDALLEKFRPHRKPKCVLAFLKADHIGGVNTFFAFLSSGGLLVFPEARDPESVCRLIAEHRVQLLPVTPTFLRMVLITEAHKRHDLSSLEVITFGTETMPAGTLREFQRLLPLVSFRQTYGLTELGILPLRTDQADPLWLALDGEGVETKVMNGTLWVRSRTAMLGYLNAEQPFDPDGWFNTQDAIETSGGRMRILGRTSDLINVGGEKVYPAEVEDVLLRMDGVRDACVFGKPNPVTGQVVAARVWLAGPQEPAQFIRSLREFCRARLAPYQVPLSVEIVTGPLHGDRFKKARAPQADVPALPLGAGGERCAPPT